MPGVSHVRMGDRFKTTRRVESRGQFVGERLIMGKAVGLGRADGLFVEAPGIEFTTFDPGDLGADQRRAIFEILRTIFRPYFQLSVVRGQLEVWAENCPENFPPILPVVRGARSEPGNAP